ncbi:DUF58 domain-containing protein [Prosthecomicrobium sp. N25]|uniref:DUF58 domain-containing protein n=1 Tax=Prosthecomicrobium sp. N25 TaxID=3129254 RepID=UPI003076914C
MDAVASPGVMADTETLLRLRHMVRRLRDTTSGLTARPGGFVSRRRGRGLETDDIRVYAEGDDVRHIDRNTTARTGIQHVRTFRDERERTLILVADLRPSMLWGTRRAFRSAAAAEALAMVGWRAVDGGARIGLAAFGAGEPAYVPARGRDRGMVAVVGGLAAAQRRALSAPDAMDPPLDGILEQTAAVAPKGASVVLATGLDRPGEHFDTMVPALARRARLSVLLIADGFETAPPAGRYPYATAAGRRGWTSPRGGTSPHGGGLASLAERTGRLDRLGVPWLVVEASAAPDVTATALGGFDV